MKFQTRGAASWLRKTLKELGTRMDVYGVQYVGLISVSGRTTGTRWFLVTTCRTHWMGVR